MKRMSLMNETDWQECIYPEQMLDHLGRQASSRKRRLFACACIRRIWPLLGDERLREAVEVAERGADGKVQARCLQRARHTVRSLREELQAAQRQHLAAQPEETVWKARAALAAAQAVEALLQANEPILEAPRDVRELPDVVSATRVARTAARAAEAQGEERLGEASPPSTEPARRLEQLDAVDLVREIFGNPFRIVTVEPAWLVWNETTIPKMTQVVYDEGRFGDLPFLADALEEAGCVNADILTHCRAPMEHVRGCWVVDALLGMK
jgi:hypothetical protein